MECMVIGVKRLTGLGKESGKPFDFSQVTVLRPLEVVANQNFQLRGYGHETSEIDLADDTIDKFAAVTFPARLELLIDTLPGRKGLRSVCIGFKQPKAA